jgi:hypothetical protein
MDVNNSKGQDEINVSTVWHERYNRVQAAACQGLHFFFCTSRISTKLQNVPKTGALSWGALCRCGVSLPSHYIAVDIRRLQCNMSKQTLSKQHAIACVNSVYLG